MDEQRIGRGFAAEYFDAEGANSLTPTRIYPTRKECEDSEAIEPQFVKPVAVVLCDDDSYAFVLHHGQAIHAAKLLREHGSVSARAIAKIIEHEMMRGRKLVQSQPSSGFASRDVSAADPTA